MICGVGGKVRYRLLLYFLMVAIRINNTFGQTTQNINVCMFIFGLINNILLLNHIAVYLHPLMISYIN